jgi:hypothetical protein
LQAISDKARQTFTELDQLMSSHNNFKNYRDELKKREQASPATPILPYFGMLLAVSHV